MIRKTSLADVLTRRWITHLSEPQYDLERRYQHDLQPFPPEQSQFNFNSMARTRNIQESTDDQGLRIISEGPSQRDTISQELDSRSGLRRRLSFYQKIPAVQHHK